MASDVPDRLRHLLASQALAVLATQDRGRPHASLVGFAATDDLRHLVFVTPRASHKFAHLKADDRAAMLIDNRTHRASDFTDAMAVTARGRAREVAPKQGSPLLDLFLRKHPQLEGFATSPDAALVVLDIDAYRVVTHFQDVTELHP